MNPVATLKFGCLCAIAFITGIVIAKCTNAESDRQKALKASEYIRFSTGNEFIADLPK